MFIFSLVVMVMVGSDCVRVWTAVSHPHKYNISPNSLDCLGLVAAFNWAEADGGKVTLHHSTARQRLHNSGLNSRPPVGYSQAGYLAQSIYIEILKWTNNININIRGLNSLILSLLLLTWTTPINSLQFRGKLSSNFQGNK